MMLSIVRRPNRKFHVNPRVRAYGKARLDIASRIQSPSDWDKLWKRPANAFPFIWGAYWKQCIEYKVDDFAAEVGFYTDILRLAVNALDPGYAMFTSPAGDFYIAIIPTPEGVKSTPPDAIRIQFMLADVFAVAGELEWVSPVEQPVMAMRAATVAQRRMEWRECGRKGRSAEPDVMARRPTACDGNAARCGQIRKIHHYILPTAPTTGPVAKRRDNSQAPSGHPSAQTTGAK